MKWQMVIQLLWLARGKIHTNLCAPGNCCADCIRITHFLREEGAL